MDRKNNTPALKAANGVRSDVDTTLQAIDKILLQLPDPAARAAAAAGLHGLVRAMAVSGIRRDDPIREICARVGDRWSSLLLLLLRAGNFRHSALRRLISTVSYEKRISQRMLTLRLRTLERDGLITRYATDTHPPGTEYALTPLGRGLLEQLETLMSWIRQNNAEILQAREQFDARSDEPHSED